MRGSSMDVGGWLAQELEVALDVTVHRHARLGGGDVAESFRFELDSGRPVFAKTHRRCPPGFFTTEARGLSWLREAGTVRVPEVLAVSDGDATADDPAGTPVSLSSSSAPVTSVSSSLPFLALEWIDETRSRGSAPGEAELGRALAELHRTGASCFGREDRRSTGSRGLPNEPCSTWAEFYASQRLLPLARLARDAGALSPGAIARLERVANSLDQLGGDGSSEPPARLHGDLWAGNRLVDVDGQSWLIDPAAHGGHREFDLAMMDLFGGFGADCFAAYQEVFPLAGGWQQRIPLHQLAPLTVHAIKFGGGYGPATERALDALGI